MAERLKILTFNAGLTRLRFGPIKYELVPHVNERLEAIPTSLMEVDADIVCLQEVYESKHIEFLAQKLSGHYPHYYHHDAKYWFDNGLMILSKEPFSSVKELAFRTSGVEKVSRKGAIVVATEYGGAFEGMLLVNLHFPYGGFGSASQRGRRAVKSRSKTLNDLNEELRDTSKRLVLVGDFNFGPDIAEANYDHLLSLGYVNISDEQVTWDPKNPLNKMFPSATPQSIDHILLNKNFADSLSESKSDVIFKDLIQIGDKETYLSDHYGVLCEIVM